MKNNYLKKTLFAFLIVIAGALKPARAQFVFIPDTNFKWFLQSYYPSCMNGDSLDTTCIAIVNETYLSCGGYNITDLTGVQYFDNLQYLDCVNDHVTWLPPLPSGLLELICEGNDLTSLPTLPTGLKWLYCDYNSNLNSLPSLPPTLELLIGYFCNFTTLPALPNSLTFLWVGNSGLTSLPTLPSNLRTLNLEGATLTSLPALPSSLDTLDINGNPITPFPSLPANLEALYCGACSLSTLGTLPAGLKDLDCRWQTLTSLPTLPATLRNLECEQNSITSLPPLPSGLRQLYCRNNPLGSLPALPSSLDTLDCSFNNLASLPALPSTLYYLSCEGNSLTSLPAFPTGLYYLNCDSNQITSIPSFPNSLKWIDCHANQLTSIPAIGDTIAELDISNNPVSCLPYLRRIYSLNFINTNISCIPNIGQVSGSNPPLSGFQLCQPSSGCGAFWNITGKVFYDNNANCTQEAADSSLRNIPVTLDSANVQLQQMLTDNSGRYSFRTYFGTYTVKVDTANAHYDVLCPGSFYFTSNINVADSIDTLLNFGVQCRPGYDLSAHSISADDIIRPGRIRTLYLIAGDNMMVNDISCAVGVSGSVQAILGGPLNYYSYLGLPPVVNGDTLTWNIADFSTVHPLSDFRIRVYADTTANIGDTICVTLNVYPSADNIPSNNSLSSCIPITNSFDPNEKLMEPSGVIDTSNQWFTFTVFFQNTGNAPAEEIYILDTLDNDLDASTFTYLNSSHDVVTQLLPGNILRFNYTNINLPDSTADEPASHGFVQYKVKRKAGLPVNTVISNTAYIYFDFNPPVVTNTVSAILSINLGANQNQFASLEFEVYPNPTHRGFEVLGLRSEVGQLDIYNVVGEKVYSQKINSQLSTVNCQLAPGTYFVKVTTENGVGVKRLVKE
jgi:uncharacterized repeat protein (TIGR01451 family)